MFKPKLLSFCFALLFFAAFSLRSQQILWTRSFATETYDWIFCSKLDPNGSLLLLVETGSYWHLLKLDEVTGLTIWDLNLSVIKRFSFSTFQVDNKGNIYLFSNSCIQKVDGATGSLLWFREGFFRTSGTTPSGGFFVSGLSDRSSKWMVLKELDAETGKTLWEYEFPHTANYQIDQILSDNKNHLWVCGGFESILWLGSEVYTTIGGSMAPFIAKLGEKGAVLWSNAFRNNERLWISTDNEFGNMFVFLSTDKPTVFGSGTHTVLLSPPKIQTTEFCIKVDAETTYPEHTFDKMPGTECSVFSVNGPRNYLRCGEVFFAADPFNCAWPAVVPERPVFSHNNYEAFLDNSSYMYSFCNFLGSTVLQNDTIKSAGSLDAILVKSEKLSTVNFLPCPEVLELFPNPAKTELTVKINEPFLEGYKLKLMDMNGLVFFETQDAESRREFSIESLPEGVYFVVLEESNKKRTVKKLVKL